VEQTHQGDANFIVALLAEAASEHGRPP
jgi:hypothetical protein